MQFGLHFVPLPGLSSSGDQVLGKHGRPSWGCDLSPPLSLPLGFLGVQQACLLLCAVCLLWGAYLWVRSSGWMSTVQNPKESWLATKPACGLVEEASLGLQLATSGSGSPCVPVSGGEWASPQRASSAQFFVL